MSSWKQAMLKELVTLQRGFDITKAEQEPGNIPVYSSSGVGSFHNVAKVSGPGVIVGRKGTLGTVFYSEDDFWPHDTTLWVKDFHGNIPKYCYYFLKGMRFEQFDSGAANPTLNRNHVHNLPIQIPNLETQRSIAKVIGDFDDLIEVNSQRIAILEEMTQVIFREWFVNYNYPGCESETLVESGNPDIGKVPKGWKVDALGSICAEVRKTVKPNEFDKYSIYVGLEHIPRKSFTLRETASPSTVNSNKLEFEEGDILFGKIRPYFHKVAVAAQQGICSSDTIVLRPNTKELSALVLAVVFSEMFVKHATNTSQGTKMPRANWKVLCRYPIVLPPKDLLADFTKLVNASCELTVNLAEQCNRLEGTRDLLLPKFVNGNINISEFNEDQNANSLQAADRNAAASNAIGAE